MVSLIALLGGVVGGGLAALLVGAAVGYFLRTRFMMANLRAEQVNLEKAVDSANRRRKEIVQDAQRAAIKTRENAQREIRSEYNRLRERDTKIERRSNGLERLSKNLNLRETKLNARSRELDRRVKEIQQTKDEYVKRLESIADISADDARARILDQAQQEAEETMSRRYNLAEKEAIERADAKARHILAESIQRMASEVVADVTVTSVKLPNEDAKGRLIGREGRNIKAIERETGVNLMLDDTPGMVVLSSFDPLRREIARISIERLMRDGRIQPARIESSVATVKKEMDEKVLKTGRDALYEVNVKRALPNELVRLMGRLKYRTSFGSNVLQHSIEVAMLAGVLAAEIGADVNQCRLAGFLHDVGKALTPEVKGAHAEIGADLAQKHNMDNRIVTAIREHHDRQMSTTESFIVGAADAISAARPGVRRDTAEKFIERMTELENIARGFDGVDNCYALQSGHELRVLVNPNGVKESQFAKLANDIVSKIEDQYKFPGEINITLIRESRINKVAR